MSSIKISQRTDCLDRKVVANILAEAIGTASTYVGPPSFAYKVGDLQLQKDGALVYPVQDEESLSEVRSVFEKIASAGVKTQGPLLLNLSGLDEHADNNLQNIMKGKGTLIGKALDATILVTKEDVDIMISITFAAQPVSTETLTATLLFFIKLSAFAAGLKNAGSTERMVENEKYAFRCYLLRLGFIGADYKTERKVLLSKLSGNSAFKGGAQTDEEVSE